MTTKVNPPIEGSDTLITQIAAQLKPILSMRFQEKHTVEELAAAIRDAVLRVPDKFKRIEKIRAAHKKVATDAPPADPAANQDASPR